MSKSKYGNYENKQLDEFKDRAVTVVDLAYQRGVNDEAERTKKERDEGRLDTDRLNKLFEISEGLSTYNDYSTCCVKKMETKVGMRYCLFINKENQGIYAKTPRKAIDEFIKREEATNERQAK